MAQYFKKAEDIRAFGQMVNNFSNQGKAIAYALGTLGLAKEEIISVVGEGHYNTLDDRDTGFIRYGKHIARPLSGLFGAFIFIHLPEMVFTQRVPSYLSQNGFRFQAKSEQTTASWPLDDLALDFTVLDPTRGAQGRGQIILLEPLYSADLVLEKGTTLTAPHSSKTWCSPDIVSYKFSMVDTEGREVKEEIALKILWGSLGAKGMKVYGENDRRRTTLGTDGTDDDFIAEGALIECLKELDLRHNTDLMPKFNELVEASAAKLRQHPEMLECFIAARMVSTEIIKTKRSLAKASDAFGNKLMPNNRFNFGLEQIEQLKSAVFTSANMLGVKLPENVTDPSLLRLIERIKKIAENMEETVRHLRAKSNRNFCEIDLPDIIVNRLVAQIPYPFDKSWLQLMGGNRIKTLPHKGKDYVTKDVADKVMAILSEVDSSVATDVQIKVCELLKNKALGKARNGLKQAQEAFRGLSHNSNTDEAILHIRAFDAMRQIIQQFDENPHGFVCEKHLIADIEAAYGKVRNRTSKGGKKRIRLSKTQSRNIYEFISLIKKSGYDFSRIISNYSDFPEFAVLTNVSNCNGTPEHNKKASLMVLAA